MLRSLGIFLIQPDTSVSKEILPEYQIFFDDLKKEFDANTNNKLQDILQITADRQGYRRLRDQKGNLLETEIKNRFTDLLNKHYEKYYIAILNSQFIRDKSELRGLIRFINGHGTWDIYFHQMHYITRDAIYYSLSKLNPQIHEVNRFFIDYFNRRNGIRHDHQNVFNFRYTLRCPDFRGSIMALVSNSLDTLERSPLFVMFMVPLKITPFGEEHLREIISTFADKMKDYENEKGLTIARDCYRKPHVMNERKLKKIIHRITRECENELRRKNELPEVGEGWIRETILFQKLEAGFPGVPVIHQGSPSWLGQQRFDIWIPSRMAAIEYNGQQHYEPIDFFGGPEGFIRQKELDERKAVLCAENGVRLFIVRYDENMDAAVDKIRARL